jgi:hypothetical protein
MSDFWKTLTPSEKGILAIGVALGVVAKLLTMGPIGKFLLLASIIALLVEDFMVWREGGESAIGAIIERLNEWLGIDIVKWVEEGWQNFSDMLSALVETVAAVAEFLINVWSDPAAAWEQFVLMMEAIWGEWWEKYKEPVLDSIAWLEEQWLGVVTWFETNVIAPIAEYFSGLWDGVIEGVKDVTGWVGGIGEKVAGFFGGGAEAAAGPPRVAAPGAGAGAGGSRALSQSTKIDVSVNAGPGMNEGTLAAEVGRQVKKQMDKVNRDAMGAFANKSPIPVGL